MSGRDEVAARRDQEQAEGVGQIAAIAYQAGYEAGLKAAASRSVETPSSSPSLRLVESS